MLIEKKGTKYWVSNPTSGTEQGDDEAHVPVPLPDMRQEVSQEWQAEKTRAHAAQPYHAFSLLNLPEEFLDRQRLEESRIWRPHRQQIVLHSMWQKLQGRIGSSGIRMLR